MVHKKSWEDNSKKWIGIGFASLTRSGGDNKGRLKTGLGGKGLIQIISNAQTTSQRDGIDMTRLEY